MWEKKPKCRVFLCKVKWSSAYVYLIVATKKKLTADTQKIQKESKIPLQKNYIKKEDSKRGRKELQNSQKAINKMAMVTVSIIT